MLVRALEQGPPFDAPVELRFTGPNLATLTALGEQARGILADVPHVLHTAASLSGGEPKLVFHADEDAARMAGLQLGDIAGQLDLALEGAVGGAVIEGTEQLPVRVQVDPAYRADLNAIRATDLLAVTGGDAAAGAGPGDLGYPGVPLSALGEFVLEPAPSAILRRDGERVNTVQGWITAGTLPQTVLDAYQQRLAAEMPPLPPGYRMAFGGESEERDDAVGGLVGTLGPLIVLMIATLVLSFNSFRLAFIIQVVAIQAMGLGLLSVAIFGYPLGFVVIIGLLGLVGLAINAGIIILAALREDPAARRGEIVPMQRAVASCARHIVSTTVTTVGGFLPLIIAGGLFWPPFAVAIAGGTVLSTIVSFWFVPAAYRVLIRVGAGASRQAAMAAAPAAEGRLAPSTA